MSEVNLAVWQLKKLCHCLLNQLASLQVLLCTDICQFSRLSWRLDYNIRTQGTFLGKWSILSKSLGKATGAAHLNLTTTECYRCPRGEPNLWLLAEENATLDARNHMLTEEGGQQSQTGTHLHGCHREDSIPHEHGSERRREKKATKEAGLANLDAGKPRWKQDPQCLASCQVEEGPHTTCVAPVYQRYVLTHWEEYFSKS